ncbi:hypothetical protein K7432_013430 [Basidiobolus ranarum]|uniref:Cytochrome P450 n=1 Tax=Basidiobolus ranarum TaxID=34480 RepID=A0ABR2WJ74_9FUNG
MVIIDALKSFLNVDAVQFTLAIVIAWGVATSCWNAYKRNKRLPPLVPYTSPVAGSTAEYIQNPRQFVDKIFEKYGSVVRVNIFGRILVVLDYEFSRMLFTTPDWNFDKGTQENTNLDYHLRLGTHTTTATSHAAVATYITPNLKKYTPRVVKQLDRIIKLRVGETIETVIIDNPKKLFQEMIANAMANVFVGEHLSNDPQMVDVFMQLSGDINTMILRWRSSTFKPWERLKSRFNSIVDKHRDILLKKLNTDSDRRIKQKEEMGPEKWEKEKPLDVIQGMMDKSIQERGAPNLNESIYTTMGLIFASVDTTTTGSSWVLFMLAKHTEYHQELLEEIKKCVEANRSEEGELGVDAIKSMVKLDSFCKEVLRIRGDGIVLNHKATKDVILPNGVLIPKGIHVATAMYRTHINDEIQIGGPANEFRPFRFVGENKSATKVAGDWILFGLGRHACPGRFLAIQEIKTIVCLILGNYEISLPDGDFKYPNLAFTFNLPPIGRIAFKRRPEPIF